MSHRKIKTALIVLGVLAAALAVVLLASSSDDDSNSAADTHKAETGLPTRPSKYPQSAIIGNLTKRQAARFTAAALDDPIVKQITAGRRVRVERAIPWTETSGTVLKGAGVYVNVKPPAELTQQRLSVYIEPNLAGEAEGLPDLYRSAMVSATGISALRIRVLSPSARVVEVEPGGGKLKVTEYQLLGSTLPPSYRSEGGD